MAGPWEKYQAPTAPTAPAAGPWQKYGGGEPAVPTAPEKPSVGGFLSNVVSSAGQCAGDVANAVTHPLKTLEGIGAIPVGIAEKLGVPMPAPAPGEASSAQI